MGALRDGMTAGTLTVSGMKPPQSDDDLYRLRYSEDPIRPFKQGEYRALLKAEHDHILLDYVCRNGQLMVAVRSYLFLFFV